MEQLIAVSISAGSNSPLPTPTGGAGGAPIGGGVGLWTHRHRWWGGPPTTLKHIYIYIYNIYIEREIVLLVTPHRPGVLAWGRAVISMYRYM